jgi:hypothetical protein
MVNNFLLQGTSALRHRQWRRKNSLFTFSFFMASNKIGVASRFCLNWYYELLIPALTFWVGCKRKTTEAFFNRHVRRSL